MHPPQPALEASGVTIRYPDAVRDAVRDVSLRIDPGTALALLGPSGSGKSTLALAVAGAIPALVPASSTGTIRRPGTNAAFATTIVQDTDAHLVALSVEDEIAFALENQGLAPEEIDRRIDAVLSRDPALGLRRRDRTLHLSGGWRQRLAIGAALAEEPPLLIADEPFAHLDTDASAAAAQALEDMKRQGRACMIVEHRADNAMMLADTVLVLGSDGVPVAYGPAGPTLRAVARSGTAPGIRLPAVIRAGIALERAGLLPDGWHGHNAGDLLQALGSRAFEPLARDTVLRALGLQGLSARSGSFGPPLVRIENATLVRGGRRVLEAVDLVVRGGEVVGLAGPNGAGKTSLALLAAGGLRPRRGRVGQQIKTSPAYIPQNPSLALTSGTLEAEAARRGLAWKQAAGALTAAGLDPDPHRSPLAFSHGERRRLAMALAMAQPMPRLIILDEPTSGLDDAGLAKLARDIDDLRAGGCGILVIGHDFDWLAAIADRIMVLEAGRIVAEAPSLSIMARALDGSLPVSPSDGSRLAYRLGWAPCEAARPC